MATFSEQLRDEFYTWEQLGRGELVWDVRVEPEPYFFPFFGHGALIQDEPVSDDGRATGVLGRFFGRKPALPSTQDPEPVPVLVPLLNRDAPDYLADSELERVEWLLTPPSDVAWPPRNFEPLLYSVAAGRSVCLEYRGDAENLHLFLVAPRESQRDVAATLASELPSTVAEPDPLPLLDWLMDPKPDRAWVRDLALHREFVFPILTPAEIGRDPHAALLTAMDDLEGSERVVVQFRFKPCVNSWADSLWRLVTTEDGKPFFANGGDFLGAVKAKIRKPLFAVTIRLAIFDASEERTDRIARRLAAGFAPYEGDNAFVFADELEQDFVEALFDVVYRKSLRSGMLLNADELLGLVHLPAPPAGEPKLRRIRHHTHPAPPENLGRKDLALGINHHLGDENDVGLTVAERCRHMHVIGASGTGKSTFLLQSILQDLESGHGLALLDPHGDLVEAVLDRLPDSRIDDVVLFDPADADFPLGFNILGAHSDIERNLLASDFVAIFERLSSSWGDQMTAVLGNAALAFLESDRGGTLLDLRRFLVERKFREDYLRTVRDSEVVYFWNHEFPLLKGNTRASLVTRINSFLRQKLIRNMVAQEGRRFNVGQLMNEGKVILAPLAQGLIGEENSWLLGSLLVSKFYQAALSRQEMAEESRRPFWLYLDEAHRFLTPSIASILSGARKYGLGLVLAHQELDQFGRQEAGILSAILTNSHTRICFRVGDHDAKRLQEGFEHFDSEDLRKLRVGSAICRIGGSDHDFNLAVDPPIEASEDPEGIAQRARDHSRLAYATPREEIEEGVDEQNATGSAALSEDAAKSRRSRRTKATDEAPEAQSAEAPTPPPPAPPAPGQTVERPEESVAAPPSETDAAPASAQGPEPPPPTEATPAAEPAQQPEPSPPETDSQPTKPPLKAIPAAAHYRKGRGGQKHKALQEQIKLHANGLGFRASIEAELPDKSGSVDVLLETQSTKVAIEVALRSPIDQEIRNIAKAIQNGIPRIVVVSDSPTHLGNIREAAENANLENLKERVRFIHKDEIGEFLNSLRSSIPDSETTTLGYKVKAKFNKLSEEELRARKDAMHRAVDEAERRRKDEEEGNK